MAMGDKENIEVCMVKKPQQSARASKVASETAHLKKYSID